MTIGWKTKSYLKQKNVKKLKKFYFKIHKGAVRFEPPKTFSNKGSKYEKYYMEGFN